MLLGFSWRAPAVVAIAITLAVGMAAGAGAQDTEASLSPPDSASSGPLFHEPSGSYFDVVRLNGQKWVWAAAAAARQTYKGRRGRLAKANTPEIHRFLVNNFDFKWPTWIGLRYVCPGRALIWSDGERHESGFRLWDKHWTRSGRDFCATRVTGSERGYMPVIYSSRKTWQAIGPNKYFNFYVIEYPPNPE